MGLLDALFGKNVPQTVTAHILDPNRGYFTETWTVGKDVPEDTVSRLGDGQHIYAVRASNAGQMKQVLCKKQPWLQARAQFDAIDDAGAAAMARTKAMLDRTGPRRCPGCGRPAASEIVICPNCGEPILG